MNNGITIALVIFENAERKILLMLRDDNPNIPFPNHWDMIGGHAEDGETPEDALRREVREEIGIELERYEFFKEYHATEREDVYENTKYVYTAPLKQQLHDLRIGEGQKLQLFAYDEIPDLLIANMGKTILWDYMKTRS